MRRLRGTVLIVIWGLASTALAEPVRLVAYIEALRERGAAIIYSDNLVSRDAVVDIPSGAVSVDGLASALGPLGLALERGPDGALLIVSATDDLASVSGVVRSTTGVRIAGAVVTPTRGSPATTDGRGVFRLGVPSGDSLTLSVAAPGYLSGELADVDAAAAADRGLQITLVPKQQPLETIVVSASRHRLAFVNDESATFIDSEQLDTLPLLAGEPARAVALLPPATSVGVDARLHVRGGAYDETLYLLDGLRIYEPFHLRSFRAPSSIFNSKAIDSLEFFAGAFPARFGDRMSAVLSVALREPIERPGTEIDVSTLNTSLTHAAARGDGRLGWLVSARRSNLDLVLDRLEEDYGTPRYGEALARATWRPSDRHALSANLLITNENVSLATTRGENAGTDFGSTYGWLRWRYAPLPNVVADSVVAITDVDSRRDGTIARIDLGTGSVRDRRRFRVWSLTQDWLWRYSSVLALSAGIDARYLEADYRYESGLNLLPPFDAIGVDVAGGARALAATPEGGQYAAWAELRWRRGRWLVEAGARWDQQAFTTASDDSQVSPRLSAAFDVGERTQLRIGWGRHYQAQGINELPIEAGIATFDPAQRSEHLVASVEHRFRRPYLLRVDAYRKRERTLRPRYENLFDPLVLLPESQFDWVQIARNQALHRGIEIMLSRDRLRGALGWWISYAWSDSFEETSVARTRTSWDQTHALRAALHWQRGPWNVTLTGMARDGWPRTMLTASPGGNGGFVLSAGRRNAERAPRYLSLDLHVARDFPLARGNLSLYLDVNNLTDRRNVCCTEYAIETGPGGAAVFVADEDGWLPLVPTLGVNWRF